MIRWPVIESNHKIPFVALVLIYTDAVTDLLAQLCVGSIFILFILIKTLKNLLTAILPGREVSWWSDEAKRIRNLKLCLCFLGWELYNP